MSEIERPGTPQITTDQKIDALTVMVEKRFTGVEERFTGVEKRFTDVDQRFTEVAQAFVEQRRYTEFAFATLDGKMNARFDRLERKLDQFIDTQLRDK